MQMLKNIIMPALVSFSFVKLIFGQNIYTNILAPLIGIGEFFRAKGRISPLFYPFLGILAFGILSNIVNQAPLGAYLRTGQYLALIYFSSFVAQFFTREHFKLVVRVTLALSFGLLLVEVLSGPPHFGYKWGVLPRYYGVLGEPNYSGLVYLGLALISWLNHRGKWEFLGFMLLTVSIVSRGAFVSIGVMAIAYILLIFLKAKHFRWISYVWLTLIFLSGPAIYLSWHTVPQNLKLKLAAISPRYQLHTSYVQMSLEFPLGSGVYQGSSKIVEYLKDHQEKGIHKKIVPWDQHNLFLQVFSNFGIPAFLIFFFFLWRLISLASPHYAWGLLSLLSGFMFLNGLSEIIFYLFVGFMRKESDE